MSASTIEDEGEEDFATILRRNTYNKFSGAQTELDSSRSVFNCTPPSSRPHSADPKNAHSCKLNPKAFNTLNSFNDMGHLSRRVFNDHGENHLTSDDFENSFGFRKVFDNQLEVTAITATTIATCISAILHELVVAGEKHAEEGHFNGSQYDIFCGGGKNFRSRSPHPNTRQKSEPSFDSSHSGSPKPAKKMKFLPSHIAEPIPTVQTITSFVAKLCIDTQTEYECIVISLIYVRRLIKNSAGQLVLLKENWKGIILSCVILANKVWDDFHMQNLDYCYVFNGLTVERINALELQLLIALDNRCNVSPSVYAHTHFEIQAMITLTSVIKGKPKRKRNRFSAKFSKVHADEFQSADENVQSGTCAVSVKSQVETVNISKVDRSSPYKFFDFEAMDKRTDIEGEDISENSAHLSVDEYSTVPEGDIKIPAPVFVEGKDPDAELPVSRKKLVHSVDLEKQKRHLRVLIQYDENSLITNPSVKTGCSEKTGETHGSNTSMLSRGNSFKLAKQHSRKSFKNPGLTPLAGGSGGGVTSPLPPVTSAATSIMSLNCKSWWPSSWFPSWGLCRGKVQDVI